jgi:hypothetical protein
VRSGDRQLRWRCRQRLDNLYGNELLHRWRGYRAEFLAPAEKLADMNTGGSRDLGREPYSTAYVRLVAVMFAFRARKVA